MNGRVIFFPLKFLPSESCLETLKTYQMYFDEYRASIALECKFGTYEYALRKEQMYNKIRDKWKLIKGGSFEEGVVNG